MKVFLLIALAILLGGAAIAQADRRIEGAVHQNGKPVAGATVTLTGIDDPSFKATYQTDTDGKFVFSVGLGRFVLNAFIGAGNAQFASRAYTADMRGMSTWVGVLDLTAVYPIRESVTISADLSQPIDEVSKTVNVITAQEMRERADITLVDSLRTIPGFRVQQLGGFGRTASIKTRGLRNQDTAVLLDGIRLRDAAAITGDASPFLSDLTLTSVSKVEVLRGSGSSLYGTNAIGGTIDFITPDPEPGLHGQVSAAAGGLGLGRFRGNLSDATRDRKFGYNVAVSRTAYTKGIDGQDNAHNTNFQSKLNYQPWSNSNLSGRFFISDAYVRLNSNPDTAGVVPASNFGVIEARPGVNFVHDLNDPDAFQRSKFFNGQMVFTQAIGNELVFQSYYSGLKTSRKNDNGVLGVGYQSPSTSLFDGTIQTANGHLDWTPNSVNKLTGGYEFEHEKFGNDGRTPDGFGNFFTRAYQSSHTLYVQDLLALLKGRLQLAGGFRWQRYSLGDPKFSLLNAPYTSLNLENPPAAYTFDGSAAYFIERSKTKLRAHVGNGYRVPSLYERFGTFYSTFGPTPAFVAIGDPGLKPEKTIAFDGGIEQYIFGEKGKLTTTYFYTKLIDTIGYGNVVPPIGMTNRPFGGYENQKGGIARGLEFSGTVRPTRSTDIFASYTLTNSDQRSPQVTGSGVIETLGIPKHHFTLVATQRIKRFWASFDLVASSGYLVPIFDTNGFTFLTHVYRFEGNRRGDVTAGYTFPINKDKFNLRVFGTVENVFNNKYYENGFRTPKANVRAGVSFGF
ncbi:MAG TPA: TonB-dependent receptor [Pyrinomonadaceae bacterium]|nr:TonB-dependent receptor [Pyrinomonadaceae bacterium]